MSELDGNREQLLTRLAAMRRRVAELETALEHIIRGGTEILHGSEIDAQPTKILDFQWWSERTAQLKSIDVGDMSTLSREDVAKLVRELQVSQVEVKMQNDELKRVHRELEDSLNRYATLYDSAPIGYFTISDDRLVLEANLTGADLLGRPRDALIGTPFSAFVCKEQYGAYNWHFQRVFKTKTKETCEIELQRTDGARFQSRLESIAVKDEDGNLRRCQTVVSDITGLKKAEEAVRESEELHRITLSSISDTVLITDDNGRFTYICPNVNVIFGYSRDEVESFHNVNRLLGPGLFEPAQFQDREEIENIERSIADKAGNEHVLLINVKQVSIKGGTTLFSCRDITERKRAEKALQASMQERLSG
jgi:PAS domain S-box-containing protein